MASMAARDRLFSASSSSSSSRFTELSAVSLGNLPDTGANATEPELKWGALGQAALTDIFTWLDALATCVLLAVAVFLIARQSACVEEADVRSTTIWPGCQQQGEGGAVEAATVSA